MYGSTDNRKKLKESRERLDSLYSKIPDTKGCLENNSKPESEGGCGSWCCLHPETIVFTDYGPVPIKDIQTWHKVFTKSGLKKIIKTGKRYKNENLFRIKSSYGREITLTQDHKIYVSAFYRPSRSVSPHYQYDFVEARNLKTRNSKQKIIGHHNYLPKIDKSQIFITEVPFVFDLQTLVYNGYNNMIVDNDCVYSYHTRNKDGSKTFFGKPFPAKITLDTEFMYMLGLFLAEGSFGDNSLDFHICSDELDLEIKIQSFARRFNLFCSSKINRGKSNTVRIFSTSLRNLFEFMCNSGCENKRLQSSVFCRMIQTESLTVAFHQGAYDGDGTKYKKNLYSYTTTSRLLAYQMLYIRTILGFVSGFYSHHSKNKKKVYTVVENKCGKYNDYLELENCHLLTIKSIEEIPYEGFVYDIEVEDEHSFYTEFGEVHNCKTQNPQVLYVEFLNAWKAITSTWKDQDIQDLIKRCLTKYLFPNQDKSCVFIDMQTNKCLQHGTRPFNCRVYGITPEEEFKPRYERLKVIYPETRNQCNLVSTVDGRVVTTKDTDNWWLELNAIEMGIGIKKETITDQPGGSYRTYHDHILVHLLGKDGMVQLSELRQKGNKQEKDTTISNIMEAMKKFKESSDGKEKKDVTPSQG